MSLIDKLRIFEQRDTMPDIGSRFKETSGVYTKECGMPGGNRLNQTGIRRYKAMKNGPCKDAWEINFCDGTSDPYKLLVAMRKFQECADSRKEFMDSCVTKADGGHRAAQRKMQRYADFCKRKLETLLNMTCSSDDDCGEMGECNEGQCFFETKSFQL